MIAKENIMMLLVLQITNKIGGFNMSKFLEKLIKWYAKFQKSDFAKKFITFLAEVFGGVK